VLLVVLTNQTVLSRRAELLTLDGGRILRYHVENTALFWLGAAVIAYVTLSRPTGRLRRGAGRVAVGSVALLAVAMWVPSAYVTVTTSVGVQARGWVDRLERTWPSSPEPPFLRFALPCCIGLPAMYPYNMSDVVLPLIEPGVRFTDRLDGAWAVATEGVAGPAVFIGATTAAVDRCLVAGEPLAVPTLRADPYYYFVRVTYRSQTDNLLTVGSGQRRQLDAPSGAGSVVQFVPYGFETGSLTVTAASDGFCVESVDVGTVTAQTP
ncbi:MAG: hypothetical protein ABI074_05895, partial [Nakamurella sp.]